MYMSVLPACIYAVCACLVPVQKKASDSLKLEFQMVVSLHVGAGNWTRFSGTETSSLNYEVIFPAPAADI